ncbi:uncharacterized protein C8A04DRAFT_13046 [Dichotomopilus funicola]|uniref:Mid2 domain-containing protein n=1 Tax=Dichotomopilus funicola TaxID=1934379 RepID=A0AAN6ZKJ1_9PEZI|nr:hypothetical protein C8A04DRAFT_13046 [Dichotomopilus funicola]
MKLLGAAAALILPQLCAAAGSTCYYPNGRIAAPDAPCNPDAENSPCCGAGSGTVCLTNGLCLSAGGGTIRGSCTDKAWTAGECPNYCMFAQTGGTDLVSCSNVTHTDTSYCCDGYRAFCCDDGVDRFDVLPSNPQIAARYDSALGRFTSVAQRTTSSSSSSSTSSATSTGTSTGEPTTSTGNPTSSSPTESSTSQPTSEPDSPSPGLSTGAQAGIGVGVAALVIALIAVVFLLFKLRKAKQAAAAATATSPSTAAAGPDGQGAWEQQPYSDHKDGPPYYSGRVEMGPGMPPAELAHEPPRTGELGGYELSSELPSSPSSWQQQQQQQQQQQYQQQYR